MVLHNPNNWHWVNKDTSGWARDYLEKELIGLKAEEGDTKAQIDKILSMEGDVDVSQRKGKVITLFDVQLQLEYSGSTKDEENVSGRITIPELAHDTEENEYVVRAFCHHAFPESTYHLHPPLSMYLTNTQQFDIDIYSETLSKDPVKDLVRRSLTPLLRTGMAKLGPALVSAHTKDLQHSKDHKPEFTPAKTYSSSGINKSSSSSSSTANGSASAPTKSGAHVNTTTVTDTEEFRTSADQLYTTFTDPQRLAAFTRAPPKLFEGAHSGGKFELFDGNVSGSYTELDPPKKLVQQWRLKQWPEGHFSTLAIAFEQNDVDAVTVMRVAWTGVPVGQEEVTKRNWREYYVRSIKTTFGFGTIL